jgi:hypothetical protein
LCVHMAKSTYLLLLCSHTSLHQVRVAGMSLSVCLSAMFDAGAPTAVFSIVFKQGSAVVGSGFRVPAQHLEVSGPAATERAMHEELHAACTVDTCRRERALTTIAELKATCIALYWQASCTAHWGTSQPC